MTLGRDARRETGHKVRVLLVDDHAPVREALAERFERNDGFAVVGQAGSLAEARELLGDIDVRWSTSVYQTASAAT